jgi:type I restriction enzyme, S subunit
LAQSDFDLPEDWSVVAIGETARRLRAGGTPARSQADYWNGSIPFVLIEDLTAAGLYIDSAVERISDAGLESSSAWLVPPGCVLLSMYATIGTTAVTRRPVATNQAILAIEPNDDFSAEFLALALRAHKASLIAKNVQATQKNVNRGIVERFRIPVPPLPEQRKIAAILVLVNETIEQQKRLGQLAAELKQVLVRSLFAGADVGGIRLCSKGEPNVALGDLISDQPRNGLYKHVSSYGSGTRILRIDDFGNDGDVVETAAVRVLTDGGERELYGLRRGDIVVNRVNSLSHLGKTALVGEPSEPMVFESNMMRFRVDEERVRPGYVFRALNSPLCKRQILGSAKRAIGQASINQGNVRALRIPLPSLDKQAEVERLIDTVEQRVRHHERKHELLSELFDGLLQDLMTARVRADNLDISELEGAATAAR